MGGIDASTSGTTTVLHLHLGSTLIMESTALAKSSTVRSYFIPSRSPYYKATSLPGKKQSESKLKTDAGEKALNKVKTERRNVEELLEAMEKRVAKLKRKEEHATSKLLAARSKAETFQTARDFVKEVTAPQLEVRKQKQREEELEELNRRRKEVIMQRFEHEEKATSSKTELLETRRVRTTQRRVLQMKEGRIKAINSSQERRMMNTLQWVRNHQTSSSALPRVRSTSETSERELQEETQRIERVKAKVLCTQIRELQAQQSALLDSVVKIKRQHHQAQQQFHELVTSQ